MMTIGAPIIMPQQPAKQFNINETQVDKYDKFGLLHFSMPGMPNFPANPKALKSEKDTRALELKKARRQKRVQDRRQQEIAAENEQILF